MSEQQLTLGLIGLGNWGRRLAGCIAKAPGMELTACFGRSAGPRQAFAAEVAAEPMASLDALLGDARIDAVMIATPHTTHADLICEASSAGKHVFVEKPMTLTVADARRCIEAASDAGVVLYVNHFRRRMAATTRLQQMAANGEFGMIQQLEAYFSRPGHTAPVQGWRNDPTEAPAGGMTALGVHMVDNLIALAGPVGRVSAMSKQVLGRNVIDDVTAVVLEFDSGPLGYLGTSLTVPKIATVAAFGTDMAGWSTEDGDRLLVQRRDELSSRHLPVTPVDPVQVSVEAFAESLRTGRTPETDGLAGLEVVAVLEAIAHSAARGGAPVDLAEIRTPA